MLSSIAEIVGMNTVLKTSIWLRFLKSSRFFVLLVLLPVAGMLACGDEVFLENALNPSSALGISSGDLIVVSGGNVANTATPYPSHQVFLFSSSGEFKTTLYSSSSPSVTFVWGADFNVSGSKLYLAVENPDHIETIDLTTAGFPSSTHVNDANLTGATMRAMATLSDGSIVAAESTQSVEKYDSSGVRVTTNFPFVIAPAAANISNIKRISGDRFVILAPGATDDRLRVYANDGTGGTQYSGGLACNTNCDPSDIVELSDGRFVVAYQTANSHRLQILDSNFANATLLYVDANYINMPTTMELMSNGHLIVCSSIFNSCEELTISGATATRTFSNPLLFVRQPIRVLVVP